MTLTHIKITHAKARDRAYKLTDADALYLVVNPTGTKLWRMNYRYFGGQKTLHFGEWPTVSLADAREGPTKRVESLRLGSIRSRRRRPTCRSCAISTLTGSISGWVTAASCRTGAMSRNIGCCYPGSWDYG
jgi:hypothetical protein